MTEIAIAAEHLQAMIARHASVMQSTPRDVPIALGAINDLRDAARDYATAIASEAKWGNPFDGLFDDAEADSTEGVADEVGRTESAEHTRLSITCRSDFFVEDTAALIAFAGTIDVKGVDSMPLGELLEALFLKLWNPETRPPDGLKYAGGGWSVEEVQKTLWEMTRHEREGTGF